jgi:hypothetical protein
MRSSMAVVFAGVVLAVAGVSSGAVASTTHVASSTTHVASHAPNGKQVTFHATFTLTGSGIMRSTGIQAVVWGTGNATLLGNSVLLATGPIGEWVGTCTPFRGIASITHIGGTDRIFLANIGQQACRVSSGSDQVHSTGTMRVLGGVGRFSSASGTLTYMSTGTLHGNATGTLTLSFTMTLQGSITM